LATASAKIAMNKFKTDKTKSGTPFRCNAYNALFLVFSIVLVMWSGIAEAKVKLKKKVPALCYECHENLKEELADPYVHFLFKQGKCITCHNSHVSNEEGLLNEKINNVCLNCHNALRKLVSKAKVHPALTRGTCADCHGPHSGKHTNLLSSKEKDICLKCHENLKEEMKKKYGCKAFKNGQCSSCHNSHASTYDNLLVSDPNKLCKECHAPACRAGNISITSITKKQDCTSCHTGHGSSYKGALGPFGHKTFLEKACEECHNPIKANKNISVKGDEKEFCLDCHKGDDATYIYAPDDIHVRDAKNPCVICHSNHASGEENFTKNESVVCMSCHESTENRTRLMEKKLKTIKCSPVIDRKCFECHIPMHSDLPLSFRDTDTEMCRRCHQVEHLTTHPVGNDIIDPRNGQPVSCISCHSMHSANASYLLTHDKNRALCIQCHKL
jgi:predicted CXXCH cytochrome family protein